MVRAELPAPAVYLAAPDHSSPRPWRLPGAPVHLPAPDHRPDFQLQAPKVRPPPLRQCPVPQAAHLPLSPCSGLLTLLLCFTVQQRAQDVGKLAPQADLGGSGGRGLPQDRPWGPETLSRCTSSASWSVHTTELFLTFTLSAWLHRVFAATCKSSCSIQALVPTRDGAWAPHRPPGVSPAQRDLTTGKNLVRLVTS